MIFESCRLRLKLSNAQILCPKGHKLRVNRIEDSKSIVLYCKECKLFYPFPKMEDGFSEQREGEK